MGAVTEFLGISGKTHLNFEIWMQAALEGDKKALSSIVEHCRQDLIITEKLLDRVKDGIISISLS